MSTQEIAGIEQAFAKLPYDEKLIVIAKLRSRLDKEPARAGEFGPQMAEMAEMAEMAADPDIQREIAAIGAEFGEAESDGLEDDRTDADQDHPPDQWFYKNQSPSGVDRSLLRHMRSLTPLERLIHMEQHAREVRRLLEYGRKHRKA